jgi:hypothetical protein
MDLSNAFSASGTEASSGKLLLAAAPAFDARSASR